MIPRMSFAEHSQRTEDKQFLPEFFQGPVMSSSVLGVLNFDGYNSTGERPVEVFIIFNRSEIGRKRGVQSVRKENELKLYLDNKINSNNRIIPQMTLVLQHRKRYTTSWKSLIG